MYRRMAPRFAVLLCLGLALVLAACSGSDSGKNPASGTLFGSNRTASSENGLSLSADPMKIVIDPDNPATPTDPAHGNKRYGETSLLAVAQTPEGAPQPGLGLTFGAAAGALASGGVPVTTDAEGKAADTLRVYEDDPGSIEVSVGDGTRITTLVVTKIVAAPPVANAGPDQTVECTGNLSAEVRLDGSATVDPNGDVTKYEWFEAFGAPTQVKLGEGMTLDLVLSLGTHEITLQVTDATGKTSTDVVIVQVVDTTPPKVVLTVSPSSLWPPNHKLVDVHATLVVEECGPYTVTLESVTSNEPDNGLGDGDTVGDIQGASIGTADYDLQLRAERAGGGSGRIYTLVYKVVDAVGLETIAQAQVKVPHDQGGN